MSARRFRQRPIVRCRTCKAEEAAGRDGACQGLCKRIPADVNQAKVVQVPVAAIQAVAAALMPPTGLPARPATSGCDDWHAQPSGNPT